MFARSANQHGDATRVQRKKTASERRAQRLRAEGRRIQHTLAALDEVRSHCGGHLTKCGHFVRDALMHMGRPSIQRADNFYDAVHSNVPEDLYKSTALHHVLVQSRNYDTWFLFP